MNREASSVMPGPSAAARRPRTIAFTSGKGGVGKSNLVLNVALSLARRGQRVTVLDGDLGLASLNVLLGLSPRHDLRHVIGGQRRLAEIVLRGPYGLTLIPAGSGVAELANLSMAGRDRLLEQLEEVARPMDFLLIDTAAGISDTVLNLVVAADEAVVVTRPEPTALADAYALVKVVVQHRPAYPFHLLVNMVKDAAQGEQVFQSLSQILVRFLGYRPGYAGHVTSDPAVGRAVVDQVPFAIAAPRSDASRDVEGLAAKLVDSRTASGGAAGAPFWHRLAAWSWREA
jgi:flagellar biosynthesis protein FlhG